MDWMRCGIFPTPPGLSLRPEDGLQTGHATRVTRPELPHRPQHEHVPSVDHDRPHHPVLLPGSESNKLLNQI